MEGTYGFLLPRLIGISMTLALAGCQTAEQSPSATANASTDTPATTAEKAVENQSAKAAQVPDGWRDATEAEVRKHYANRTLTATTASGYTFKNYYKPDGTYDGACCGPMWNYRRSGVWSVTGNKFCSMANTGPRAGRESCVAFMTDGKELTTKARNSSLRNVSLEDGNKLP